MIKVVIITTVLFIVFAVFVPLLVLLILGTIQSKLRNTKIRLMINKPYKMFFGFGKLSDKECYMQVENFDCGVACAENALNKMGFQQNTIDTARKTLKAPVHAEQLRDYFNDLKCNVKVIKNCDEYFLQNFLNQNNSFIALMKITYVFRAKWNYATFLFFRKYIGLNSGHHWVVVESINNSKIQILDPSFGRIIMKTKHFVDEISEIGLFVERNFVNCQETNEKD